MKKLKTNLVLLIMGMMILLVSCEKKEDLPDDSDDVIIPPDEFVTPETKDIVMYEINLRAYSNSGDLQGVIDRLEEIDKLGINVIWLMPIHPIGEINSVNSPYSVKNYKEVNPEFGNMENLKTLVNDAHELGMAVILDWVANHTAWDNPWITNEGWYTTDGNGNIVHPPGTNWLDVADLNYDNHEMRLSMIDAMKFWIDEAHIDGFRCDAADMVPFDFWEQALDSLSGSTEKDLVLLAEGARTDHFEAGFDMIFSWDYYNTLKNVFHANTSVPFLYSTHNAEYNNVPEGKHRLRFTTNHDESAWDYTPIILFNGEEGALAASVVTIFLGGVPMIYSSQEVGVLENVPFFSNAPINWSFNQDMLTAYQDMIEVYNSSESAKTGTLETYNHQFVAMFSRITDTEEILIIVNTRHAFYHDYLPEELKNTSWINMLDGSAITLTGNMILEPYEYLILKK